MISGIVFSELIPLLIENIPDIKFTIIKVGSYELQKKLILKEVNKEYQSLNFFDKSLHQVQ
ncbi:hypothetical protein BI362_07550 [Streptococcus parauberis]|uniref:Uncharacterized protein n=3 Tax=Streptococcus parauberis TaxID=1348 RepID=F1YY17_9STRE|nr:hypothetical protein [Streptococcus parauberis]EGE53348.1 hypothetical protein SPB_0215 [Streptococcus parauberis NCFD 2020]EMF49499.1 hypothetical protein SPJ2_0319 [Streptococcus parauberis KRS-02109]EMG26222.1 hypothetical protein SPJ1_0184 [Streptococcus parauberis KRS-02083]MDT2730926.1 hypothetical protein [Streptococcus parauberis]MDT2748733.1 hypothetical protein [Streptococcus parauberis]